MKSRKKIIFFKITTMEKIAIKKRKYIKFDRKQNLRRVNCKKNQFKILSLIK